MASPTTLPNAYVQNSGTEIDRAHWWNNILRRSIAIALWVISLLALAVAAVLVHNHPGPWPIELAFTRTVQSLPYWSWLRPIIVFFGTFNNPTPSGIGFGIVFTVILLMGWYRQAIFLALTVGIGDGIEVLIGNYVARPRPSPALVHVDVFLKHNSFPSGHVCHEALFYGFLLFLSFTRPVRGWRYRWALIPLQVFAALNILMIGFSRVYQGEHWAFDTLAGYLSGALGLALFILLYQWTTSVLEKRHVKREQAHLVEALHVPSQEQQTPTEMVRARSLETVQVVEKKAKPYEELFIKCKEDWIHHLAQALSFSSLTALVPNAIVVVATFGVILGGFGTQVRQMLTANLEASFPSPLSSSMDQALGQAVGTFAHGSAIAIVLTLAFALLFGSLFFSLLETCFDVVYHLPPRPFLRRHLVALSLLFLFVVLTPISLVIADAPTFFLSLLHVVQAGDTPGSNLILRLAGIAGSIIISLLLFEAVYVMVPHRHITFRTLGRHIRKSWRGVLMATAAMQLFLLLFPLYTAHFLGSSIGQVAFAVLLLLFLYVSTLILLFGAEVNAFFAEGIRVPKNDLITQASRDEYR
ncbi:MAG: YhjD/YihY/BrkB family envelope integrity protein [Ktedonobacteraceae bacterium]